MNQGEPPIWGCPQMGNQAIGDTLLIPKDPKVTRIHFQNVNGVSLGKEGTWEGVCETWKNMGVDIGLICEHKLDLTTPSTINRLKEGATQHFGTGSFRIKATSTPVEHGRTYKPGGVLGMTIGPISGRIMKSHQDEAGRWVAMTLRRREENPLTIICTYQVVDVDPRSTTVGPTTYATQLHAHYRLEGRHHPENLRCHHANDLVNFVKQCQLEGDAVLLVGDLNEVLGLNQAGMNRLLSECNLVDIVARTHLAAGFTTYQRGRNVIDYCLMDASLVPMVIKCGYEPFNANIISDHRGIFVDFSTSNLFRGGIQPLAPTPLRDISTKRPHQLPHYFEAKQKYLQESGWFARINELSDLMDKNERDDHLAEILYNQLIKASNYAGQKLKPYPLAPYSPAIAQLRTAQNCTRILISSYTNAYDTSIKATEARNKLGSLGYDVPDNLLDCKTLRNQLTSELKKTIKAEEQTKQRRKDHIDQLISKSTQDGGPTAAILKRIKNAGELKAVFYKCARARGKQNRGGLSHLLVPAIPGTDPKSCDNWELVDCPEEIEILLEERNRNHFGQSRDCNLTSPPFDFSMLFTGTCHIAEAILNGNYTSNEDLFPPHSDDGYPRLRELTRIFLDACNYVEESVKDSIPYTLTAAEYKGKITNWNERTSTSPCSNMHLGHLKAYWARHLLPDDSDEAEALEAARDTILKGHLVLLNYALQYGYSFDTWKKVVNTMLEKEPGNPRFHRLRVIHLYEADYNLILAVKWRQLLRFACDKGYVNESLFGSQPGKEALDGCFLRELEYEITRLTRKPIVHFDNDATSCYDRIPVFIANVVSRKYGMDRRVCMVHGRTLAEAKYFLKTKLGISSSYIQHCRAHPVFGNGQGAGDSPQKWLFLSSTLFDIYEPRAAGSKFASPDGGLEVEVKLVGFVDDVRNSTNLFGQDEASVEQLIQVATNDSQLWHDLLLVCNQSLELPKCGYHTMAYEFDPTGRPSLLDTPDTSITITDALGNALPISQWPNSKAAKYLGTKKSISNQQPQYDELLSKCNEFARITSCSHFNRRETHVFYWAIYRLSVGYALPTCRFTEKQLTKIQAKAHRAMVAHCGYNRNTAATVLYAPLYLGGAGFFHLYDDQGYGQVKLFMKFWRSRTTTTGKLLRVAVAWAQFCAGIRSPILEDTSTQLPHLEAEWLSSLRQFLQDVQGQLELDTPFVTPLQRQGDAFLMDLAIQSGKFKPTQLRQLNYCRLYLNVLLVSDISNANGTNLNPETYRGSPPDVTTKHKVNQKRPNSKSWMQWRRLMYILADGSKHHRLRKPLGKWLVSADKFRKKWTTLHDHASEKLFYLTPLGYTQHSKLSIDYDKEPDQDIIHPRIPLHAVPVDTLERQYTWSIMRGWKDHTRDYPSETPRVNTVVELATRLATWERLLLHHLEVTDITEDTTWHALTTTTCYIATDGSAPSGKGSFAWVISDSEGEILAQCHGPVFGAKISSYRAEAYGILSVLRYLLQLSHIRGRTTTEANTILPHPLVCDNKAIVDRINRLKHWKRIYPNVTMESDWDVLAEIKATLEALGPTSQPTFGHIKGHQDSIRPIEELPLQAQLNCKADELAEKQFRLFPQTNHSTVPLLPTAGCQLHLAQGTSTHDIKRELSMARAVPPMKAKLCHKNAWSEEEFQEIDWVSHGRALHRLSPHRVTLVKYMNDILPIGKVVHRYNPKYPSSCPSCQTALEDREHFWTCPAISRDQWRKQCQSNMLQALNKLDTAPPLQSLLLDALDALIHGKPVESITVHPLVKEVADAQAQVGWHQILKGRFVCEWRRAQDRYYSGQKCGQERLG